MPIKWLRTFYDRAARLDKSLLPLNAGAPPRAKRSRDGDFPVRSLTVFLLTV